MVEPRPFFTHPAQKGGLRRFLSLLLPPLLALVALSTRAAIQFDVFPGYDGIVRQAAWFPMVCEVKNDGPAFMGVIEVTSGQFNQSQTHRVMVELPTGTLKRLIIPIFSTASYQSSWDVRLLDERGRLRSEQPINSSTGRLRETTVNTTVVGALPRTATGVPTFREISVGDKTRQPSAARIQPQLLPDNPLVMQGMNAIYLNSEKAIELNEGQVAALLTWLNLGGNLIIGVEQINDINATTWLRSIFPGDLKDIQTVSNHSELQDWVRDMPTPRQRSPIRFNGRKKSDVNPFSDLPDDPAFEKANLQVATGTIRDGEILAAAGDVPLIIQSHQGRGLVTALLFSPEREPVKTWKNLPALWARVAGVDSRLYGSENYNGPGMGGWSVDGVFGAMIDSKQIRKLPVEWLLLLLIVYLVVIGPLDQYWLKRIKRPMLTWITFPCYVVLFSLLIYFIGYKLRAGETEWNEIHLVDVLPNRDGAALCGHTYASIYSPVNATYRVEGEQLFSTFRGEFQSWSSGQGNERAEVFQNGDNYKADIFVPVWTSQLYESDWLQPTSLPIKFTVAADDSGWSVTVLNQLERAVTNARVAVAGRIMDLGDLPAGQTKTFKLGREQGTTLTDFVHRYGANFQSASESRRHAFGGSTRIEDLPDSSMAASFISEISDEGMRFVTPPGLDLGRLLDNGNAVLLAWESDYSPIGPINRFPTRRSHKDTLWRVSAPIAVASRP